MKLRPVDQTKFGAATAPLAERGDCFPACIASIIGCGIDEVPHIYGIHENQDDANRALNEWLDSRGWAMFCFHWNAESGIGAVHLPNAAVILSGKSPRGEYQHAVVGEIAGSRYRVVHDPHNSRDGLDGDPTHVEVLFPMVRLS